MDHQLPAHTPENEALSKELDLVRKEFLDLYTRHKVMVEDEANVLTSLYYEKLGKYRLELLTKQTEASRLKMKMQLIQAAINRDEQPDLMAIDYELNERLQEYYADIAAQSANIELAQKLLSQMVPEEVTLKLRELFRLLCKKLHPDLNPDQSEERKDLFIKVKAAYDLLDLTELQKILLYLDEAGSEKIVSVPGEEKKRRIEQLKSNIATLKAKIDQLIESFPFNLKQLIFDEMAITAKREEWKELVALAEQDAVKYRQIINIMINE